MMRRLAAAVIAAGVTGILVTACGGSSASGDYRACQMLKNELTGTQRYTAAEAAALTPGLKKAIGDLAYGQSIQGGPLGPTGVAIAELAVSQISVICSGDGVTGIGQA